MIKFQNAWSGLIVNNHCRGIEDVKSKLPSLELNPQPGLVHLFWRQATHLASFSSIPAPWYSGWVVECVHRELAVAFLEAWGEPDLHPVLHSPKQQRPMAWITALGYKCPALFIDWDNFRNREIKRETKKGWQIERGKERERQRKREAKKERGKERERV